MLRLILPALALLLVVAGPAIGQGTVINHANYSAIDTASQATCDQIGDLRIFFAHASVGYDITNGMTSLHNSNANRYQLSIAADDATPPATTTPGTLYHYDRGNTGWSAKVSSFNTYVNNGWRAPKIDVAINKFCFIDGDANVNTYISSMVALENANPTTTFVYVTMPLTTGNNNGNYLRTLFNNSLRQWATANGKFLFDIADIEAWDSNGAEQTFMMNNVLCQKMASEYTSDYQHPNTALGRMHVGKGMYSMYAAIVPEPASLSLLGLGGLALLRRRGK